MNIHLSLHNIFLLLKKFITAISLTPLVTIYWLACLTPKNRRVWLFSSWQGKEYKDNPKYIYQYVLDNCPGIAPIWITKNKNVLEHLKRRNFPAEYAYSLKGMILQLTAGVIVFTHSVEWEFIRVLIGGRTKQVQAWHGIPIKKIGFDTRSVREKRTKWIASKLLPFINEHYDLVIACGQEDAKNFQTAFNIKPDKIAITGFPRNDILARSKRGESNEGKFKLIYMPTFRGCVGSEFQLFRETELNFPMLDSALIELNVFLDIKLHPVQGFSSNDLADIARCLNIAVFDNSLDVYETIGGYDALITDFSSVYFDFMITGKPIIMAPLHQEIYLQNDRQLYYIYDDICTSTPCYSWSDILTQIKRLKANNFVSVESAVSELTSKFHKFTDDQSTKRVVERIHSISCIER